MAGAAMSSTPAASGNLAQQSQRRPPRHSRHQTPKKPHFNRGVPSFNGDNSRSRSGRSLPRPSWTEGSAHGGYPYEANGQPPFHAEGSRTAYNNHQHNGVNTRNHHNGNGKQHSTRVWWTPFSSLENAPVSLMPRECPPCNVTPTSIWDMIEHLCSIEHCRCLLAHRTAEFERTGQSGPRLMCELCHVPLLSMHTARNHFAGGKHRSYLRLIKQDLYNSGCVDVPLGNSSDSYNRPGGRRSSGRPSSRGGSIDDDDQAEDDRERSPATDTQNDEVDYKHRDKTPNGLTATQPLQLQPQQTPSTNNDGSSKDRWKQPSIMSTRRSVKDESESPRKESTIEEKSGEETVKNEKDSRKHQYFVSSEEEHSDEETKFRDPNQENDQRTGASFADGSRTPETRPKVPLGRPLVGSSSKSLVDKRKDILSKLSNCTDVRDLTKQLRQIGRGADEKQKTARKRLPGVAFTNRDIEKQETFAEARAKQAESSTEVQAKIEDSDDCTVVAGPPEPPPQTISDSEDGEQPPHVESPLVAASPMPQQPLQQTVPPAAPAIASQSLPNDDIVRLAALTSEEAACQERLRYFSQTLPRVEALLGFLRQEEHATAGQLELIRAAKGRIAAAVTQGPQPPQGADIFGPSQILNAILNSTPRTSDNLAWLLNSARPQSAPNSYSLQNVLGNIGTTPSPVPSSTPALLFDFSVGETPISSLQTPAQPTGGLPDTRKRSNASPEGSAKRSKNTEIQLDEQLHSQQVLAVKLCGDFLYSSSRDGVVKRTPLSDGGGSVVVYRHCGQDSNSNLKRVCAYMIEVSVHKKLHSVKLITGSDDCALRVFDGESGHLMKVIPVQARVLCGFIAWQKIYIGLKSGYIQVYNLLDQRFVVESEVRQVPKFVAATSCTNSKNVVVVTQDNAMMLRDAGTLFLLYAVDKRDQKITGLIVRDDNILLAGESKVYIFDKSGRLCREVDLEDSIFGAVSFRSSLLVASVSGFLNGLKWKALMGGQVQLRAQLSWTASPAGANSRTASNESDSSPEIVVALHCDEASKRLAIATESGRVAVLDVDSTSSPNGDAADNSK